MGSWLDRAARAADEALDGAEQRALKLTAGVARRVAGFLHVDVYMALYRAEKRLYILAADCDRLVDPDYYVHAPPLPLDPDLRQRLTEAAQARDSKYLGDD